MNKRIKFIIVSVLFFLIFFYIKYGVKNSDEVSDIEKKTAFERYDFASGSDREKFIKRIDYIFEKFRDPSLISFTKYVHSDESCMRISRPLLFTDKKIFLCNYDCSGFAGVYAMHEIDDVNKKLLKVTEKDYCMELNHGRACSIKHNCGKKDDDNFSSVLSRPLADDFYDYFVKLDAENDYFVPVNDFRNVEKGDIIAAAYDKDWQKMAKENCSMYAGNKNPSTGHIMIAMSKPYLSKMNCKTCCLCKKYKNSRCLPNDEYIIKVADASEGPHRKEQRKGSTGIGKGYMYFGVDDNGQPIYYRWSGWNTCAYLNYKENAGSFSSDACIADHRCIDDKCSDKKFCETVKDGESPPEYRKLSGIAVARIKN